MGQTKGSGFYPEPFVCLGYTYAEIQIIPDSLIGLPLILVTIMFYLQRYSSGGLS